MSMKNIFFSVILCISSIAMSQTNKLEKATFGAGCFWCVETLFQEVKGVQKVLSGYEGGALKNPTYKDICTGTTGHAEVIQIEYDPNVVTYKKLLEIFWEVHDPTTLNRQGNDVGTQYRSVIFYHNDQQQKEAEFYKSELNKTGAYTSQIITEISPSTTFYVAENYHQNYYNQNGSQPYCQFVIAPKVAKFRKAFEKELK